jgi:thiamine kinase-like enzyme
MTAVPTRFHDVTPDWLSHHLGVKVAKVDLKPMPGIVGTLGEVGIFTLTYAMPTDLPTEFIGKMPLDSDMARMYNGIMNYYPREGGWYREFISESPFTAPKAHVNVAGDDPNNTLLLIERVAATDNGDILIGTSFERHAAIVESLAKLHGRFWGRESLRSFDWLYDWMNPNLAAGADILRMVWDIYNDMHPGSFPADLKSVLERTWVHDTGRWLAYCDSQPFTLCHGDYQLDNILFVGDEHVVIDYQGCMRSYPGFDIGWYLASSLPGDQVKFEDDLIELYRKTLAASGGKAYTHDEMMHELALFTIYSASGQTLPAMQDTTEFGDKGERMRKRFDRFLFGSIEAAQRWDTVGRIGSMI